VREEEGKWGKRTRKRKREKKREKERETEKEKKHKMRQVVGRAAHFLGWWSVGEVLHKLLQHSGQTAL